MGRGAPPDPGCSAIGGHPDAHEWARIDPTGVGLVLSCVQSMYDDHENFLGVAGLDVSFDYLIENLLEAPEFANVPGVEFFLLDPEGRIAVRSAGAKLPAAAEDGSPIVMPAFPDDEVVAAIHAKRTGYAQISGSDGQRVVLYNRMGSIGWYYVISGPAQALMHFSDGAGQPPG